MDDGGGEVTVFWAVAVVFFVYIAGFVVDGAAQIRAVQKAQFVAGEAARYGAQEIVGEDAVLGQGAVVDEEDAQAAAEVYLGRMSDVTGTVSIVDGAVVVDTRCVKDAVFLDIIGIPQVSGRGHAEVQLVRGYEGVER